MRLLELSKHFSCFLYFVEICILFLSCFSVFSHSPLEYFSNEYKSHVYRYKDKESRFSVVPLRVTIPVSGREVTCALHNRVRNMPIDFLVFQPRTWAQQLTFSLRPCKDMKVTPTSVSSPWSLHSHIPVREGVTQCKVSASLIVLSVLRIQANTHIKSYLSKRGTDA